MPLGKSSVRRAKPISLGLWGLYSALRASPFMNHLPPPWATSSEAASLRERLREAPHSLLMLDYDGTLAPFHVDRFEATPYPGVEARMRKLSVLSRVRLVLVSGRNAHELRDLIDPDVRPEIWGSHGRELLRSDGAYELFGLDPVEQAALDRVKQEMSDLGYAEAMEVKPSSVAFHWRRFEPAKQEQIRSLVETTFGRLGETGDLQLLPFDGGLELRSVERTKGTAVAQILAQEPEEIPVAYLGDDLTDEDAFAAAGNRGYSILVRNQVRASSARFWLRPPGELLAFLDDWIAGVS